MVKNSDNAKKAPARKIINKEKLKRHSLKILSKKREMTRGNHSGYVKRLQNVYSDRGLCKPDHINVIKIRMK